MNVVSADVESPKKPVANLTGVANSTLDRGSSVFCQLYWWPLKKPAFIFSSQWICRKPWSSENVVQAVNRTPAVAMEPGAVASKGYEVSERRTVAKLPVSPSHLGHLERFLCVRISRAFVDYSSDFARVAQEVECGRYRSRFCFLTRPPVIRGVSTHNSLVGASFDSASPVVITDR